ncbi:MAG: FAD-dependent monooxygenase [Planctomycetota bacterium]
MRHVAIVGAGAGGASLAVCLAERGLRVTLVESRAFPRAKVCGEFISPAATADLEAVLPPHELQAAGAKRVDRLTLELGDRIRAWTMPSAAWALSRRSLDAMLVERAADAGATILQPERVASIEFGHDGVRLTLGSKRCVEADAVVHADGSGRFDPAGPTPTARGLVGLKCHARPSEPIRGIRMRASRGAYCGAIGVEAGLATFAMCATPAVLAAHENDRDALLAKIWPGYDADQRDGDWMACGVARSGYIEPGHPRSFRIGNAAAAVDPVGGEGIGLAIWSAARLAELLTAPGTLEACQSSMATLYRRRLRSRRPACRVAAELLMRPDLLSALWPALLMPSLTIRPWYRLTGKPA